MRVWDCSSGALVAESREVLALTACVLCVLSSDAAQVHTGAITSVRFGRGYGGTDTLVTCSRDNTIR